MKEAMLCLLVVWAVEGCSSCGSQIEHDGFPDTLPDGQDWITDDMTTGPCTTPGQTRCNGTMRETCEADGAWVPTPCEEGLNCVGPGQCSAATCMPGDRRCSSVDPAVVEECTMTGEAWVTAMTCPEGLICRDGGCVSQACVPGEFRCAGVQYRQCDADGMGWSDPMDCPTGQACNEGACTDIICEPGTGTCSSESSRLVCNDTGTAMVEEECLGGYICIDAVCRLQICPAGLIRCIDDLTYEVCNDTGTAFDAGGSCNASAGERCIEGQCLTACGLAELHPSSIGCVFYAVDLDQADEMGADSSPYAIVVSNTDDLNSASVVVEDRVGGAWRNRASTSIGPNSLYTFRMPADQHVEDTNRGSGTAYRVTSDRPIIAYQFNPIDSASQWSNDASLLIPKSTLDTYYYGVSWPKLNNWIGSFTPYYGYVTLVGTADGTTANVTVPVATLAGGGIPALGAGATTTLSLNEGDVAQIAASNEYEDLTGVYIESSAPVAVFGGCECADVPLGCSWCRNYAGAAVSQCHWCDHIEEQMFPLTTWGSNYIAARVPVRSAGGVEASFWRVIASEAATTVNISFPAGTTFRSPSGMPPFSMGAGQVISFEMAGTHAAPGDAVISADHPILVVQYIEGQECTDRGAGDGGDPAMILMVPVEQYLDEYIFLTPNTYAEDYLTVIKPTTAVITLDGAVMTATPTPVTAGWEIYRVLVGDGVHAITGTEPFGIVNVGYSPYVSYGYMGGLALERINPQD